MTRDDLLYSLRTLLRSMDRTAAELLLRRVSLADLSEALTSLEEEQVTNILFLLPVMEQSHLFAHLDPELQDALVAKLPRAIMIALFENMPADDRADIYKRMDEEARIKLLPALAKVERDDILKLSSYPEGTVGSITTSDYATVKAEMSVSEALRELRIAAPDKETIYDVYVLNDQRQLIGHISLSQLVLSPDYARVGELMRRGIISAHAEWPREEAARLIARHDLFAIPVVDGNDRMIGIVTVDDAMDVSEEENTEDFHKAGGIAALGEVSVKSASVFQLYRKRVFWLVLLVFANILSGAAIANYEETIASYVALVFFLPLLMGSSGNAGSQASTLMVRALATGDVEMTDWIKMLGREFSVAALLGITMAVVVSVVGVFRGGPELALVVSLSMILVVVVGSLLGMSLPFVLQRLKFDPASASAPLITSVADISGVIIYLSIAVMVLGSPAA